MLKNCCGTVLCGTLAAGEEVWSHKVSRGRGRRPTGGQQGGGRPRGKALNFCQAQITTPFFTPLIFNWANDSGPRSYELQAHTMIQFQLWQESLDTCPTIFISVLSKKVPSLIVQSWIMDFMHYSPINKWKSGKVHFKFLCDWSLTIYVN